MMSTGTVISVNGTPLLGPPAVVTTMFPVAVPAGTVQTMVVLLQELAVASIPLNVTVEEPWVAPNPVPLIVMVVPTIATFGETELIAGMAGPVTVKFTPFDALLDTVTTTFPVVAPVGTEQITCVDDQDVQVAVVPLNVTVELLCVDPKV